MKIVVSGAHNTGKTTLIAELNDALPRFSTFDEPYYQLLEEGHMFSEIPCLEDFELQLKRSVDSIMKSEGDCLFDRCPYDILAYLVVHDESDGFDINGWLPEVKNAIQQLDFVIYVPIEYPDRMSVSDFTCLRRCVDEELQSILLYDRWALGLPVVEVKGTPGERVRQVLTYLKGDIETI